jgi:imidazolonepropionase-like amidohydrolase
MTRSHLARAAGLLLLLTGLAPAAAAPNSAATPARAEAAPDLAAARALFERNLDAIRHRDRTAYLACYLDSPGLIVTGPAGSTLGYESLAKPRDSNWPDAFEGLDLRLTPVRPGLVYGTYRYRVRYGADEQSGLSERLFVETPDGWRIALTTAFPAASGQPPPPLAVVGGTLIDGTGGPVIANAVIVVRDGKIEAAGPRSRVTIPAGVDTLDARGRFVVPGLIDTHVHFSQTGWVDGRPDALDLRDRFPYEDTEKRLREHPQVFQRAYLASGVTTVFDVGGYPWTVALAHAAEANTDAPHMSAAGPLLSTYDFWLNLPAERQFIYLADTAAAVRGVRYLESLGSDAVKVWFIVRPGSDFDAMTRDVMAAGAEARRERLPLIVHATGLKEAKVALRAGARLLVHSVDDHPVDAEFLALAKRSGAFYCPTLTVIDGYAALPAAARTGRAPNVDDPFGAVDSLTRAHVAATAEEARRVLGSSPVARDSLFAALRRQMADNLLRVRGAGIPIVTGTDAGNPLTLHGPAIHAEMEAMQHDGMRPAEVLIASTREAARAMGRAAELGTIEKGKSADLLIVGGDPTRDIANMRKLEWVMRSGVARRADELRAAVAKSRW